MNECENSTRQKELRAEAEREWEHHSYACGIPEKYHAASLADVDEATRSRTLHELNDGKWIYLEGPLGSGKTHLLVAIVRAAYIREYRYRRQEMRRPRFYYVPRLLADIRNTFGFSDNTEDIIAACEMTPFLALDDLGAERHKREKDGISWAEEVLSVIVNDRYNKDRLTAISTNLSLDQLKGSLPRIASRLTEKSARVPLLNVRPERGG